MNLDLLIKLVKLANNNPSENEANLAARKVCRIIAEGNYKFIADSKTTVGGFKPTPKQEEVYNNKSPRTWNDVRRSTEPEFSSKRPTGPGINLDDFLRDFKNGKYTSSYPPKEPPRGSYYYGQDPFKEAEEANKQRSKNRKCSSCGQEFDTYNVREPFICFACEYIIHNIRY